MLNLSSMQHDFAHGLVLGYEQSRPKLVLAVVALRRRSQGLGPLAGVASGRTPAATVDLAEVRLGGLHR